MSDKFAVRLREGISPSQRAHMAGLAAPHFGIGPEKIEKLLARAPGIVTKPTAEPEARRVAEIFTGVGADAEVVPVDPPAPAVTLPSSWPTEAEPDDRELAASVLWSSPRADWGSEWDAGPQAEPRREWRPDIHPAASPEPAPTEAPAPARYEASAATMPDATPRRRRFSLRWKLLLASLLPIVVLVAAVLYFAYTSVADSAVRLLSEVGDNIALTLASDMSTFITENGLQLDDPADLEAITLHFARELKAIEPGLHDAVGVHLTDASGQRITGLWEPEIQQNPDFGRFAERFDAATQAALQNADFGDSEAERAASLKARTKVFESFYVIGAPLINDSGTVQVVLTEGNVIRTALDVVRPIVLAALVVLLVAILVSVFMASALSRNIRRLAAVADRISIGELDEPVVVRGNDETRDVAESLERMRLSLQSAIGRLRRRGKRARG